MKRLTPRTWSVYAVNGRLVPNTAADIRAKSLRWYVKRHWVTGLRGNPLLRAMVLGLSPRELP